MSYKILAAGNPMTLEQYRDSQQQVATALEQRTPGLRVTILGIDGDKGSGVPRLYKARRQMTAANGQSAWAYTCPRSSTAPVADDGWTTHDFVKHHLTAYVARCEAWLARYRARISSAQ